MNKLIPHTTILAYHNILPRKSALNADMGCIPLERLEEHIDALQKESFANISLQNAFERLTNQHHQSLKQAYAITFDDGYENLHEFLPELIDRIQPTIFIITDYAGTSNLTWNTRAPIIQSHLSLEQMIDLKNKGVDLEFHGTDHHNLMKFNDCELHARFRWGIDWFKKKFCAKPRFISYPYGYCDERITNIAASYFEGGVTVTHGEWFGAAARYALNRISVPAYLTGKELVEVIRTVPADRWLKTKQYAPWYEKG